MSVQYGIWNEDGAPVLPEHMEMARAHLRPYGPDEERELRDQTIAFLYCAFHTTAESRSDAQPFLSPCHVTVTWDGRLDNREELGRELGKTPAVAYSDVSVVAAAYERWGAQCFGKLVGDWAAAIWDPARQSLFLARDVIGARSLYYSRQGHRVVWSTIIDPVAQSIAGALTLNEAYLAGWFALLPAAHLTPFSEILTVPPGSYVGFTRGRFQTVKYWEFSPGRVRYGRDADYEDHFRTLFAQSVKRRLRSDAPVLAELSGGMDSSSIVCMSDYLNERGVDERSSVDTVSYFNDEEPNWNEKPYFLKVEERRGKAGLHIDVSPQRLLQRESGEQRIVLLPGNMRRSASSELKTWIASHGSRVLLSGTGGDEVTGGVPTPIPELQDLLARAKPTLLAQRLQAWALYQTRPWIHILGETVQGFLNTRVMRPAHRSHPRWIRREFLCRNSAAFVDGQKRIRLFGALPSFQSNLQAIEGLQRQLSCSSISSAPLLEKRYPFLDRDLLDFLFKIPREQLVRPGQRRSLLRRSLAGIVPDEILNRRRKAYVSRFPMAMMSELAFSSIDRSDDMILSRLGYVDGSKFREAIDQVRRERTAPPMALLRAAGIEEWLAVFAARDALSIDSAGRCRVNLKAGH